MSAEGLSTSEIKRPKYALKDAIVYPAGQKAGDNDPDNDGHGAGQHEGT